MKYNLNFSAWGSVFAVPTRIIDEFINEASGVYIKVLLLILRNQEIKDTSNLASLISMNETDINEAVSYWIDKEVLFSDVNKTMKSDAGTNLEITDVNNNDEQIFGDSESLNRNESGDKHSIKKQTRQEPNLPQAVNIPAEEINRRLQTNSEIKFIIESAEQILNHPITSTEVRYFLYIYDTMGLPADVIIMVVGYCVKIERVNIKYIYKVCESWSEQNIDTHEKAEKFLKSQLKKNKNEREIRSHFGIDRNLTAKEQQYVNVWTTEFGFKIDIIHLAYERTINAIGKLSFPYINKILSGWNSKGYKTEKDISAGESSGNYKNSNRSKPKKNNTSYDIDAFEKLEFKVSDIKLRNG